MKEKEEFVRAVRRSGGSLCINIPKEVVQLLGLKDVDMVRIQIEKR